VAQRLQRRLVEANARADIADLQSDVVVHDRDLRMSERDSTLLKRP
jgi:hypothetical protein